MNQSIDVSPANKAGSKVVSGVAAQADPTIEASLLQGEHLEAAAHWQQAGELYRGLLGRHPGHGEASFRMGRVAVQMKVPALGLPYFEAALAAEPQRRELWIAYVDALIQANRVAEARDVLAMARKQGLDGAEVDALTGRVEPPLEAKPQGRKQTKLPLPKRSKPGKAPTEKQFNQMVSRYNMGDLAGAEREARTLCADFPGHWSGWKMLGVVLVQTSRFDEAVDALARAVTLAPKDAEAHNNLGIANFEAGRLDAAESSCRRALALNPRYPQALFNLGTTMQTMGKLRDAEEAYRAALAIDPGYVKALSNLGSVLVELKRFDESELVYRRALELRGEDAGGRRDLASALQAGGRSEEAENDIRRAIELNPKDPLNHRGLAEIQHAQGDLAAAEASLRRALDLDVDCLPALNDLGLLLVEQRRFDDAVVYLSRVLDLDPRNFAGLNNLALCFKKCDRLTDAEKHFRAALAIQPDNATVLNNLGAVLQLLNRHEEAEALIRKALNSNQELGHAHMSLGVSLKSLDRLEEAIACFRRAAELGIPAARIREGMLLPSIIGTRDEMLASRSLFEQNLDALLASPPLVDDPQEILSEPNFYLAYHGMNDRGLQIKVAEFYRKTCPKLSYVSPHCAPGRLNPDNKLRVGFYSRYLYSHSVSKCYGRMITDLSRMDFAEVFLISTSKVDESIYSDFQGATVKVTDRLLEAQARISELELDVLVYLDIGMEPMSYFLGLARLARAQCVLPGHPVTTGISTIDYFLSAEVFELADADEHYSEKLVRLPGPLAGFGRPEIPVTLKSRDNFGLPANGHLYMCPMKLQKLHPDFDEAIAGILERDKDGYVVLFEDDNRAGWKDLLLDRFASTIAKELRQRILFLPWQRDYKDFVGAVVHADVLLDPFHFGIGSTVIVIGATGTPQVSRPGQFLRGRVGAYYNELLGVPECTVGDTESYVRVAVDIATKPELRARLAKTILANGSRIYDQTQFSVSFARFLNGLKEGWTRGEPTSVQ